MNEGMDFSQYPNSIELRRWGAAKRPDMVSDKGSIPKFLIVAWNRTHPDRQYDKKMAHHGTVGGYNVRGCRCLGCCDAGRRNYAATAEREADAKAEEFLDESA